MAIPFLEEKDLLKFKSLVSKEAVQTTADVLRTLENIFLEIQKTQMNFLAVKLTQKEDMIR